MARTPRIKSSGEGTAYYHLISRCSNRQFLFSAGFVRMWIVGMASRHKDAHEVMGIGSNETVGYSSHGWRLADTQREMSGLVGKSGVTPFKRVR